MSPARARAKRGEGELLRDELLAATEELLIETGSEEAVSIRAVADRVGVTPPSIYRHFADKDALLFEVCNGQFDRLKEHLDGVMAMEADATDRLMACGRAYVEFGLAHPEHYRIMFMERSDWTPEQYAEVIGEGSAFQSLVDVVTDVVHDLGVDRDPHEVALLLWASMHGITSLRIVKPDFGWPPVERMIDDMCRSHLRGTLGQS